jgi:signal transduction histidine kinase
VPARPKRVSTRIGLAILGIAVLAIANSGIALLAITQVTRIVNAAIDENFSSIRASDQLDICLLRQNALTRNYILDGGKTGHWLENLADAERQFDHWLAVAKQGVSSPREEQLLRDFEACYRQYANVRDQALASYQAGATGQAQANAVLGLSDLYGKARQLCLDVSAVNQQQFDATLARASRNRVWAAWAVVLGTLLTLALTLFLTALFFVGVFFPLRRMVNEAQAVSGQSGLAIPAGGDELRIVAQYLRTLMNDALDSRAAARSRQMQLEHAERLASVGRLAANVAHEIRNPLNAIRLWLHSIEKATGDHPELQADFRAIIEEIARLERIVRTFLEFSRPPLLRLRLQDVTAILTKASKLSQPRMVESSREFCLQAADPLPPVSVDEDQFLQVLLNLLNNALEASPDGTPIRLTAAVETSPDGPPLLAIRVTNRGPAISAEVHERIFEPFFSTKQEGTGLGLCIAAQIIAGHGGRLALESSTDEETTFAIWLPVATPSAS